VRGEAWGDRERDRRGNCTFQLAQDAVHSAGAATARHGDVELVGVFRHGCWLLLDQRWMDAGLRMAVSMTTILALESRGNGLGEQMRWRRWINESLDGERRGEGETEV
jgi:hypothetical protein